jgi:hypothetical protein
VKVTTYRNRETGEHLYFEIPAWLAAWRLTRALGIFIGSGLWKILAYVLAAAVGLLLLVIFWRAEIVALRAAGEIVRFVVPG